MEIQCCLQIYQTIAVKCATLFFFVGSLEGLEMAWVIGDQFADRSFTEYFRHVKDTNKERNYTMTNFEVSDFTTTQFASSIRQAIPRLLNLISKGIKERKYLPMALIMVVDNDITRQLKFPKPPCTPEELKVVLQYLVKETHRKLTDYKNKLPTKCKKENFPHVIWIMPPSHKYFSDNPMREMFTSVMEQIIEEKEYNQMCCLHLKKCWDESNGTFYMKEQRRYTPEGLMSYWAGIDAAIKFWHKTLQDVLIKKMRKANFKLNIAKVHTPKEKKVNTKTSNRRTGRVQHYSPRHSSTFSYRRDYPSTHWRKSPRPEIGRNLHHNRKLPSPPPRCRDHR